VFVTARARTGPRGDGTGMDGETEQQSRGLCFMASLADDHGGAAVAVDIARREPRMLPQAVGALFGSTPCRERGGVMTSIIGDPPPGHRAAAARHPSWPRRGTAGG